MVSSAVDDNFQIWWSVEGKYTPMMVMTEDDEECFSWMAQI